MKRRGWQPSDTTNIKVKAQYEAALAANHERPAFNALTGRKSLDVKPSKHRNIQCDAPDGEHFASKHERDGYLKLVAEHGRDRVIRQVSIPLTAILSADKREPGEKPVRMILDYMLIEPLPDGRFIGELIDAKGRATQDWLNKAKMLRDKHHLKIRLI